MANWALVIGINNYQRLKSLKYAQHDAELMRDYFSNEANFERVFYFADNAPRIQAPDSSWQDMKPTYTNILSFLHDFFEEPKLDVGDNFWFFFSGHGLRYQGQDYLVPCEGNPRLIKDTTIALSYVAQRMRRSGADNVILLLDACRNENELGNRSAGWQKQKGVITVPSFYMGRYPVTQAQWKAVAELEPIERELDPEPSNFKEDYKGIDRWMRPVEQVSWEDAKEFCARLTQKTGKQHRLPTEAEWEYACRARTTTPFHFGETISTEIANYDGNYTYGEGVKGEYREQTTPVGYFKVANNFGLCDMHGNVWEWCEDDWHEDYQDAPTDGKVWVLGTSSKKVLRGGSWVDIPVICRSAYRVVDTRVNRSYDIGFRVVRVVPRTT